SNLPSPRAPLSESSPDAAVPAPPSSPARSPDGPVPITAPCSSTPILSAAASTSSSEPSRFPGPAGPTSAPPADSCAPRRWPMRSWGRDDTVDLDPDVFDDCLAAAGQAFALVIVDLPRHAPPQWTRRCHHVLLVSPARVRSAVAASQVAKRLSQAHPDVRLVVRETGAGGLDSELLADSIGLSLAGSIRDDRGLSAAVDRGEGIPGGAHLGRLVDRLLGECVE